MSGINENSGTILFAEASTVGAAVAKTLGRTAGRPTPPPVGINIAVDARATR